MTTTYRDINRADLWVPGGILGGALLHPGWDRPHGRADMRLQRERDHARRVLLAGGGNGPAPRPPVDIRPIVRAELDGDITPTESAALVWCSLLRVEAGLEPVVRLLAVWRPGRGAGWRWAERIDSRGTTRSAACLKPSGDRGEGWWMDAVGMSASGLETGDEGKAAADAAALAAGRALREPGLLLLPLPDGVVGQLPLENA